MSTGTITTMRTTMSATFSAQLRGVVMGRVRVTSCHPGRGSSGTQDVIDTGVDLLGRESVRPARDAIQANPFLVFPIEAGG